MGGEPVDSMRPIDCGRWLVPRPSIARAHWEASFARRVPGNSLGGDGRAVGKSTIRGKNDLFITRVWLFTSRFADDCMAVTPAAQKNSRIFEFFLESPGQTLRWAFISTHQLRVLIRVLVTVFA